MASLWGQYLDNLELSKSAFDLGPYLIEAELGSQAVSVRSPLQSTPAGPLQMVVASWPTSRCSKQWCPTCTMASSGHTCFGMVAHNSCSLTCTLWALQEEPLGRVPQDADEGGQEGQQHKACGCHIHLVYLPQADGLWLGSWGLQAARVNDIRVWTGAQVHYTFCSGRVGESEVLTQHLHRIYHNPVKRQAVMSQLKGDRNDIRKMNMLMEFCNFSCGVLKPGPPITPPPSKHMLSQQLAQPSPCSLWARQCGKDDD